ncbi:Uncharacterised protein [Shigella sonnei]|nr:Uncharacterised protein [Shigella sonnei]
MTVAARNTQGDGAVVMAPRRLRRHIHSRLEAAIRVHVWCQQRHRRRHQVNHPGEHLFQQRRIFAFCVRKHILATIILHTDMDMHPAARVLFIRLRHKSGVHLMLSCHQTHQAF